MASITKIKRKNGIAYRIEFFERGRKFIRLPTRFGERTAQTVKEVVERLVSINDNNLVTDKKTLAILESLAPEILEKLEGVGLIECRKLPSLQTIWSTYLSEWDERKQSTKKSYESARVRFFTLFNPDETADDITLERAQAWRAELGKKFACPTIASTIARARTVFRWAVKKGMANENFFLEIERGTFVNKSREFFLPIEVYKKLLDACPCLEWRVLLALCRIGGLRNPSETSVLKWGDVDFNAGRFWVTSPKTERYENGKGRLVPLFPLLRVELEQLYKERKKGEYILTINLNQGSCWRGLKRIAEKAGVTIWPRLFHNLRGSRSNELYREFSPSVAAYWLGHSPIVAMKHYLHPIESDYTIANSGGKSGGEITENDEK